MSRDKNVAGDLVVVGAGVGGKAAARRGAANGLRTILIDPSWPATADQDLGRAGVIGLPGRGRLDGPGRVRVIGAKDQFTVTASRVILATGSRPTPLPAAPFDGRRVLSADDRQPPDTWPASAIVLGAGADAVRWSARLQAGGCATTLVSRTEQILPDADPDDAAEVRRALVRAGVVVHTGSRAREFGLTSTGVRCALRDQATGTVSDLHAAAVLVATGRRPRTDDLGLDSVAVVRDRQGRLQVDGAMQTPQPGVYAIGDLVPSPRRPHVARYEGLVAADHAAARPVAPVRYQRIPLITPTRPEIAALGLSELAARQAGYRIRCRVVRFADPKRPTERWGRLKLVADADSGSVLGLHLVGSHAADLLADASAALGFTADLRAWSPTASGGNLRREMHRALRDLSRAAATGGSP